MRLKSTSVSFSGKQATPVKKVQKRPIVSSSSSTSPEDNRPLRARVLPPKWFQFPFAHGLRPYCLHQRLCVQIGHPANRLKTLFRTPQAFVQLSATPLLLWTLRPLPLRQKNYSRVRRLVLKLRHFHLQNPH